MRAIQAMTSNATGSTSCIYSHEVGWEPAKPSEQYATGMFDVLTSGNRLRLMPRNAVAAALLSSWLAAEAHPSAHSRGDVSGGYGVGLEALEIEFVQRPLLTNGGDPTYTGQAITAEERVICLAAIAAHRAAKQKPVKRGTKAK